MNNPETEDKSPALIEVPEGSVACAVPGGRYGGPRGITALLVGGEGSHGAAPLPEPPAGSVCIPCTPLSITPFILWQLLQFHRNGFMAVRTPDWYYACTIPPRFQKEARGWGATCNETDGNLALLKVGGVHALMRNVGGSFLFSDGVSMVREMEACHLEADAWLEEETEARMRHFGESCLSVR